jgi:hypothetical protein
MRLRFNPDMTMASEAAPILEIPLPVVLQQPAFGVLSKTVLLAMAAAASSIGTLLFIKAEQYTPFFSPYAANLVPCMTKDTYLHHADLIRNSRMVEIADAPSLGEALSGLKAINPDLFIAIGLPLDAAAAVRAAELASTSADTLHLYGSDYGREVGTDNPRYLKDMIREVHLKLVENKIRHRINLVFSGGIAMAEHLAKSLICGADAVGIDLPLLIALECRLCKRCTEGKRCPVKLEAVELDWGKNRIVNLLAAWHNQLLEVMGACGIREARRMRGEIGRSMWFDDLERDSFGPVFGKRKVTGIG